MRWLRAIAGLIPPLTLPSPPWGAYPYPQIRKKWSLSRLKAIFGGTGFPACTGFSAQPGKAVPPIKKLVGNDKLGGGGKYLTYSWDKNNE
jgi:hypothetical protein